MNFAEGKGPKTIKRIWPLGQFITLYGNNTGATNPAATAYPPLVSGVQTSTTDQTWNTGVPGSVVPGLNLNVNGNAGLDVGFVCAPGSMESIQDIETTAATLTAEAGWAGSAVVSLQGTADRYTGTTIYSSPNWTTIASTTVTTANVPYSIKIPSVSGILWNAYRLIISGTTASGIVDWAIGGMFTDFSAMNIGTNATDTNGGLGQLNLANPRNITISGGAVTSVSGTLLYENLKANHTWIG